MGILSKLIDKRIASYQNNLMATHYLEVENMYREMRGWRHDYLNHISVIKSYALLGDYDSLLKYLDELNADLSKIDKGIKTGNKMLDSILNSKIALAESKNVPISVDAQISIAIKTPEIDLCIILGNLFDNAIEASLSLPEEERMIRVYMEMKHTQLYMSFTNMTSMEKRKKQDGRFDSTKTVKSGFGLVRIDDIVKRHGGYINRNSEDGAFSTEILLPQ
ncbi:MAG: GHKL domain-containing protein [Defluviitaleaceae bacterium]|nr:GHKL domain-containing protein [Defluviitaleaceae bacterium]